MAHQVAHQVAHRVIQGQTLALFLEEPSLAASRTHASTDHARTAQLAMSSAKTTHALVVLGSMALDARQLEQLLLQALTHVNPHRALMAASVIKKPTRTRTSGITTAHVQPSTMAPTAKLISGVPCQVAVAQPAQVLLVTATTARAFQHHASMVVRAQSRAQDTRAPANKTTLALTAKSTRWLVTHAAKVTLMAMERRAINAHLMIATAHVVRDVSLPLAVAVAPRRLLALATSR